MVKAVALLLPVLALGTVLLGGAAAGDWLRNARPGDDGAGEATSAAAGDSVTDPEQPGPDPATATAEPPLAEADPARGRDPAEFAYLEFPQKFFVPLVRNGTLRAVMILSLSLEVPHDLAEAAYRQENRLRDALLRALLIHANSGGFDGNFTADAHVELLRETLLQTARDASHLPVHGVMIGDIARQDQ